MRQKKSTMTVFTKVRFNISAIVIQLLDKLSASSNGGIIDAVKEKVPSLEFLDASCCRNGNSNEFVTNAR